MKFTIWEKNTIHDVLDLFKHENADQLEDLMELKELFDPKKKERELFNTSLGTQKEGKKEEYENARKEVHKKSVNITLKKAQLLYLKEKVRDKNVRLPAITQSLDLLHKIDNALEKLDEV